MLKGKDNFNIKEYLAEGWLFKEVETASHNLVKLQKLAYTDEIHGLYVFAPHFKIVGKDQRGIFDIAKIDKLYRMIGRANKRGGDINFEVYPVTEESGVLRKDSTFESISPEDFRKKLLSGECRCLRSRPFGY